MILKKIGGIFLVILLISMSVTAQVQSYANLNSIDRHVRKTPDSVSYHLKQLHNYLSEPAKNQTELARAFYMWIINNIKYDDSVELLYDPDLLFFIGSNTCSSPVCVLNKRLAVCEGYSHLFQYFCNQSGIECYSIGGYITKNGSLQDRATHSWNAAKIDGYWFFFDLSWAHAILHHTGIKSKANEYFMASPEEFVMSHLPMMPMYQFLENPIPIAVFNSGEEQITKYLKITPKNYHYTDSIAQYEKLSSANKRLKTASEIYRTNPNNRFNLGVEYYRYARAILNFDGEIDASKYYHLIKAKEKLQECIQLFTKSSDISSQLMLKQATDNLAKVERILEVESSNFIYLK